MRVDIAQYAPLYRHDRAPDPALDHLTSLSASQTFIHYCRSKIGRYQARQPARYPLVHRDLPPDVASTHDLHELHQFRQNNLRYLVPLRPERARRGSQALDFHPLGHLAMVGTNVAKFLNGSLHEAAATRDPTAIEKLRHTGFLHDVGEAMHPDIEEACGKVIGDIGADVGKTDEDRRCEGRILREVLRRVMGNYYTPEFAEGIAKLSNHEVADEDPDLAWAHAVLEGVHEINTINTATYLARLATRLAQRGNAAAKRHAEVMIIIPRGTKQSYTDGANHKLEPARERQIDPITGSANQALEKLRYAIAAAEAQLVA